MKPTFLIVGRPRSRTAWLANFLTVPPASICIHEGLADAGLDYGRLRDRMDSMPTRHVGSADTGFIHAIDRMIETWPGARIVLLTDNEESWEAWRPGDAIRESVDRDYETALEQLLGYAYLCDCRTITRDEGAAHRLWDHCLPGVPFSPERWRILRDLNVQVHLNSLARRFTESQR